MTTDKSQGFQGAYMVLARSLLMRSPGFQHCPVDLLDELGADADIVRLSAQELLVRRGERAEHLVMVVEGVLSARISISPNHRHLLAFLLPGMTVGFLSLVDAGPMPHDLVAHTPAVVLRVPMPTVRRLCLARHELMQAFHLQLAERLRTVYDTLVYSKTFSLRERVITQLVTLADSVGLRRGESWALALPMSQAELADLVGAGRQSVNAELQRLQALELVRVTRSHVEVLDLEGLRRQLPAEMPLLQLRLP